MDVGANRQFLIIVIAAILIAVAILNLGGQINKMPSAQEIPFETIAQGVYSGYTDKATMAINQEVVFSDLWAKMNSIYTSAPPLPQIDFAKETALAVFMGQKSSGGYLIEIAKIAEENERVVVFVKEAKPPPSSVVTLALTQPYHIVKTGKITKSIEFKTAQ